MIHFFTLNVVHPASTVCNAAIFYHIHAEKLLLGKYRLNKYFVTSVPALTHVGAIGAASTGTMASAG